MALSVVSNAPVSQSVCPSVRPFRIFIFLLVCSVTLANATATNRIRIKTNLNFYLSQIVQQHA